MSVIAVVGAGPGLGLAIAKQFGGHGFDVALVARNAARLDKLAEELAVQGITAAGFPADVMDRPALEAALDESAARFGPIDVLEYSPLNGLAGITPVEVTVENLKTEIELYLYGAVTATQSVLGAMLQRGAGTLLFTTGGGAINPYPRLASINAAQAALRNWVLNLHATLGGQGIQVANVAINVFIGSEAPEGVPHVAPDELAKIYWEMHTQRDKSERLVTG